jgi:hypothetical protein
VSLNNSPPLISTPEQPGAPSGKKSPIGLGKPSRPRPLSALSELHQVPGSVRTPLSSSTLLQPTAASAARAAAQNGASNGGDRSPGVNNHNPNASPLSQSAIEPRRLSVSRRERSKLHKSAVAGRLA